MKKIHLDQKNGTLKIGITQTEDFWYVTRLVEPGDIIEGLANRKITVGGSEEKGSTIRRTYYAHLKLESAEYSSEEVRLTGLIVGGSEELPRGNYQTITARLHDTITIRKIIWSRYHDHVLKESMQSEQMPILICVHDREEAYIAKTNRNGYDVLLHLEGDVQRKRVEGRGTDFYKEIRDEIIRYLERYKSPALLLASPAFFKEDLAKLLPREIISKTIYATCGSVTKNGIDEVMKRPEAKEALKTVRASEELRTVDEIFVAISKNGPASYGWKDTFHAAESGAITALTLTESFVTKVRSETPAIFDQLLRGVEKSGGVLHFVSDTNEGGKRLNGIGGIAALLRYKMYQFQV